MIQITSFFGQLSLFAMSFCHSFFLSDLSNVQLDPSQLIWDGILLHLRDFKIIQFHFGIPIAIAVIAGLGCILYYLGLGPIDFTKLIVPRENASNAHSKSDALRTWKPSAAFILVALLTVQCTSRGSLTPLTKEMYITQFDTFINKVEHNKMRYDVHDWKGADVRFKMYSRVYFSKFSDALTQSEKEHIQSLRLTYHVCKGEKVIQQIGHELEDTWLELENKLFEAIENHELINYIKF